MSSSVKVEYYYSRGVYPVLSKLMRILFGWSSISMGDLFYSLAICFLGYRLVKFFRNWKVIIHQKRFLLVSFLQGTQILVCIWLVFQVMWGFNYYREGIDNQFNIKNKKPVLTQLDTLTAFLLTETNRFAPGRKSTASSMQEATKKLQESYDSLALIHTFLRYEHASFKASVFGVIGNYMGYGGYYNPFSGEAQINVQQPAFLLPFTGAHEVAHQLGYAKESEANFIGYLAASCSTDSSLRYAANLEMFLYSNNALYRKDSLAAKFFFENLSPIAKKDLKEYRKFLEKYEGPVDRLTTAFYTRFLRINNQPEGMGSYSRVVVWLWNYFDAKGVFTRKNQAAKQQMPSNSISSN